MLPPAVIHSSPPDGTGNLRSHPSAPDLRLDGLAEPSRPMPLPHTLDHVSPPAVVLIRSNANLQVLLKLQNISLFSTIVQDRIIVFVQSKEFMVAILKMNTEDLICIF
jgi:hypothetical protein